MNRQMLRRAVSFAEQSTEWLALIILLALATPPMLLRHRSLSLFPSLNVLDGSWILDMAYKAANGIWLGRDVAFTYGPLYQWVLSAPSRWIGLSIGAINSTWYNSLLFAVILCAFFTARLLFPKVAVWRRTLFFVLALVFWSALDVRGSFCLLAFAIFLRLTVATAAPATAMIPRALVAAGVCISAFLLSADTGLYTVAAFLLCVGGMTIETGKGRRMLMFLVVAGACFGALVLLTNAIMSSPLHFKFWQSSLAVATTYRWFEPIRMDKQYKRLVLETLALGIVVFGAAWWWRNPGAGWTRRPAFLLSGFCLGLVMMQSSLVRSGYGQVLCGVCPMIVLCGAIAIDEPGSGRLLSIGLPVAATVATFALANPFPMFLRNEAQMHVRQVTQPILLCPQGLREFDRGCFVASDAELLSTVSDYVRSRTSPRDPIAIFPYETAFGIASRRQVAGGVLQSYLVNGAYLTSVELTGLRQASPPLGLYFPDGIISGALDGVPNFTRSPDVWFYFLRHYRVESSPAPGVLGLMRDDTRDGRITFHEEKIAEPTGVVRINKRSTALELGEIQWPAAGADFLKLRLRVNYPLWWRVRKPSKLTLRMTFPDGSDNSIQFVMEPDRTNEIWVYPWEATEMARYFSADESEWRRESRPAISKLKLLITAFDWISVVPHSVTVEAVEAVRVSLR